jgi:hypothetical protein
MISALLIVRCINAYAHSFLSHLFCSVLFCPVRLRRYLMYHWPLSTGAVVSVLIFSVQLFWSAVLLLVLCLVCCSGEARHGDEDDEQMREHEEGARYRHDPRSRSIERQRDQDQAPEFEGDPSEIDPFILGEPDQFWQQGGEEDDGEEYEYDTPAEGQSYYRGQRTPDGFRPAAASFRLRKHDPYARTPPQSRAQPRQPPRYMSSTSSYGSVSTQPVPQEGEREYAAAERPGSARSVASARTVASSRQQQRPAAYTPAPVQARSSAPIASSSRAPPAPAPAASDIESIVSDASDPAEFAEADVYGDVPVDARSEDVEPEVEDINERPTPDSAPRQDAATLRQRTQR